MASIDDSIIRRCDRNEHLLRCSKDQGPECRGVRGGLSNKCHRPDI